MPRRGEYLFQRKGSAMWWVRFQFPPALAEEMGTKKREQSLRTSDRRQAEIMALPLIERHKRLLLRHSLGLTGVDIQEELQGETLGIGEHVLPSGQRVFCTGTEIH